MQSANNPLFAAGYLLNDNLPRWAFRSFLFAGRDHDGYVWRRHFVQPTWIGARDLADENG